MKSYTVGKGIAPKWCGRLIAAYKRNDGTTGYEFYGKMLTFELQKGDVLMKDAAGKIHVKRKGK